jgi:anti-sigma-K factor RskA
MSGMDRGRFDELKDAYVLGALPEEDRRAFEEHLAAHPERQAEIDELRTIAGLLALSALQREPPPALKQRVMGTVRGEARTPRAGSRMPARFGGFPSARSLALGAAALLAVSLVIGLFSWGLLLQREVRDLHGRLRVFQTQDGRTIALQGSGAAEEARAELVVLEGAQAILVAENMPPLPEDRTFQIWVIEGGVPRPSGLFEPEDAMVAAVVESPLRGAEAIAVTAEPDGGSPKPTTDPVLKAEL